MGFPRILSKNNKIYTKLGEFCLSGDAFWIICQVCQQELQSQDQFWKHIQDEHNFMHGIGLKLEQSRNSNFADVTEAPVAAGPPMMPLPLYRKVNEDEQHAGDDHENSSQGQHEPKDYTEMRAIEPSTVDIDIKVEPHCLSQTLPLPSQAQTPAETIGATPSTLYQMPQAPPVSAYATIVHNAPTLPTLHMSVAPPPPTAAAAAVAAALLSQELPKDSNSTTASASSAVSSDDGERWYICDYETCGLKFKYQSRLELHRSVHSKERRFACELCGASFKQSCNLSTHRKKKHFLKGSRSLPVQQQQPQQRF